MTTENGKTPTPEDLLRSRMARLADSLTVLNDRADRRRKVILWLCIVLTALSSFALLSLTRAAFKLDAHALTQVARLEIEERLPEGRAGFGAFLRAQAPNVIEESIRSLLAFLPDVRAMLVRDYQEKLRALGQEGERTLCDEMERSIDRTKKEIDQEFPGLSDAEKLDRLVTQVTVLFEARMKEFLDALYPDYVGEMRRIESFLSDLNTYDDSRLSGKERLQKELIRTLLRLAVREKAGA